MESVTGMSKLWTNLYVYFIGICYLLNVVTTLSIVEHPRTTGVQEGQSFTLHCVIASTNQAYVVWYKAESPGSSIPLSSYRTIRREAPEADRLSIVGAGNAYNLRVDRANTNDESRYQCVAYSRGSSVKSRIASVTLLNAGESVLCQTYPQHVHLGDTLRYTCRPPPSMSSTTTMAWWRGEQRISGSQVAPISGGGLQLRYVVGEMDNYVPFTCTVGTDYFEAYGLNCTLLPLQIPLTASLNPTYNKVPPGRNAAFRCSAVASPPVNKIKWLVGFGRNAKVSGTGGRYEVKNDPLKPAESTLVIKHVGFSDNGTSVRCVLQNEVRQKDIVQAYVIVSNTPVAPRKPTTAVDKTTELPTGGPQDPGTRINGRIPNATTARMPATTPGPTTTSKPVTKHIFKPYFPDVEIHVHNNKPTDGTVPSNGENGDELGNSLPQKSNSLVGTFASLFVLFVLVGVGGVVYFVVFRRKLLNKNNFNGEIKYRKSYDSKGPEPLTSEENAAARMSLRLQTIEVVVNQPPPEWEAKLQDVKPTENEYTVESKLKRIPESPPPAYSKNAVNNENDFNGEERRSSHVDEIRDCIYALPAKKSSTTERDNKENHHKAARQVSDTRRRLLSLDYNEQVNGANDEIEWDQSSWDNSSCEDADETLRRNEQMRPSSGEQIYANTPHDKLQKNIEDDYGPTYGNLPLKSDPEYSRVASLMA